MKNYVFFFLFLFTINLYADFNLKIAEENKDFNNAISYYSLKEVSPFVYIGDINDMRGLAPSKMSSIVSDETGQIIQVVYSTYDPDVEGFTGYNYRVSTDGGNTWSQPQLISSSGPFFRGYAEIARDAENYPYVIMNYRTSSNIGIFFTTDLDGAGGGSWTTPRPVSDTTQNMAYMPTIDATTDGQNLIVGAYDIIYGYGWSFSSSYGAYWSGYSSLIDDIIDSIYDVDQISIRYVNDQYAVAVMDIVPVDTNERPGVVSGYAAQVPYYKVYDMGTGTWGPTELVIPDTLPVGYLANNEWVVDENGDSVHTSAGTWWYWWDMETNGNYAYFAMSLARGSWLVYNDTIKWYRNGKNQIFFFQKDIVNGGDWTYTPISWIDSVALDTLGTTKTWVGNCSSANISFDQYGNIYVIYIDYPDTSLEGGLPMIATYYSFFGNEWYYYNGSGDWENYVLTPPFYVDDTTKIGYYLVEVSKNAYNDGEKVYFDMLLLPSDESCAYYYRAAWDIYFANYINIVYPNGGEKLSPADIDTIKWYAPYSIDSVEISYSIDNGNTWIVIDTVANSGGYRWVVPSEESDSCKIRISGGGITDISDNVFSISSSGITEIGERKVYLPSLVKGGIDINYNFNISSEITIKIYDISGREIKEENVILTGNNGNYRIPLNDGVYFVTVYDRETLLAKNKVVVIK